MTLWHFPVYLLYLPHIAEEVSCKSRILLKVETVDIRMCLRYSLQGAKYQHCFSRLTNLFCKKKWKEDLHPGQVPEWEKDTTTTTTKSNQEIFQSASMKGYFTIIYISWGIWDLTSMVCWVAGLESFATVIQSFCCFTVSSNFGEKSCICFPVVLQSCFVFCPYKLCTIHGDIIHCCIISGVGERNSQMKY